MRRITISVHNLTHILLLLFTNAGIFPTRVHAPRLGLGAKRTGLRILGYPVLLSPPRYPLAFSGFLLNSRESDDRLLIWYLTKFGERVVVSEASTEEKLNVGYEYMIGYEDGSGEVTNTFENMWDLTPDMDLLMELPEEYTLETALVDLIEIDKV
ncbi:hypothetical protein V6N11_068192 [Hibiscus sabdariffa]|uniref:Uncharacterized protein n=1 Tax=Hibiscus sabdariffa TaxID=183260 RepID=A0ABR2STY0_9ROSI